MESRASAGTAYVGEGQEGQEGQEDRQENGEAQGTDGDVWKDEMNNKPVVEIPYYVLAVSVLVSLGFIGITYGWFRMAAVWVADVFFRWAWGG